MLDGWFDVSVYGMPANYRLKIANKIKAYNKKMGSKVKFFQTRKRVLTAVEIIKKNLFGKEIIAAKGKKFYLGLTFSVYNPFEFKKMDIGRPM